jgi:hypothetical protein
MKKLLLIAVLSLLTTKAQSTNTVLSLRLTFTDEVGVTNNTSINIDENEAMGFLLGFDKDKMTALQLTNPVPTFQNSIRATTRTYLLKILEQQALANEAKTNKLDILWNFGSVLQANKVFTPAQKTALRDIAQSTNVTSALTPAP